MKATYRTDHADPQGIIRAYKLRAKPRLISASRSTNGPPFLPWKMASSFPRCSAVASQELLVVKTCPGDVFNLVSKMAMNYGRVSRSRANNRVVPPVRGVACRWILVVKTEGRGRIRQPHHARRARPLRLGETARRKQTNIGSLGLMPGRKFRYIFDFSDSWWHEITVEQTNGSPERGRYPRVVEKRGAPPQYPNLEDDWE